MKRITRREMVGRVGVALGLTAVLMWASPAAAGVVGTFDSTGTGATTFAQLQAAHDAFMGTTEDSITFNDLSNGQQSVGNHYLASKGVAFSNESATWRGILPEGHTVVQGALLEDLDGYDGTYMPNGDKVYVKWPNSSAATPLTVTFTDPVQVVGSFVLCSIGGADTMTVKAYDSTDALLTTLTVDTAAWADADNHEGFWGIRASTAEIMKVTIKNDSSTNYGNMLGVDNLQWTVPEPATMALLALGGVGLLLGRKRQ